MLVVDGSWRIIHRPAKVDKTVRRISGERRRLSTWSTLNILECDFHSCRAERECRWIVCSEYDTMHGRHASLIDYSSNPGKHKTAGFRARVFDYVMERVGAQQPNASTFQHRDSAPEINPTWLPNVPTNHESNYSAKSTATDPWICL
jgi:hypothetical protein